MCQAWKNKEGVEMEAKDYRNLPETLRSINISGGEPFLREDLPQVLGIINERCRSPRIIISTNGILVERIKMLLPTILKNASRIAIRISIDGIEGDHDRIRGIPGNFTNCLEVIKYCKTIGVKDIGIGATISKFNEDSIFKVKELADKLNIQFTCTVVHSSDVFGDNENIIPKAGPTICQLIQIQESYLNSAKIKDWIRAYFTEGLIEYIGEGKKIIKCEAGKAFIFIKENGDIFPCNLWGIKLGNILENEMEEICERWDKKLRPLRSCGKGCWMVCAVAPMLKKNPFIPSLWVIRKKTRRVLAKKIS